jgi:primary-amine oxidase
MTELAQHLSPSIAMQGSRHPLDPLSQAELASACNILNAEKRLGPDTRFAFVQLEEPAKAVVLSWKAGKPLARRAAVTVFDCKTGSTHLAVVDIGAQVVATWREHPTKTFPFGQAPVIIEEFFKVGDIVKADAG